MARQVAELEKQNAELRRQVAVYAQQVEIVGISFLFGRFLCRRKLDLNFRKSKDGLPHYFGNLVYFLFHNQVLA